MSTAIPPRIGVSTYREIAAWGAWQQRADLLPSGYADAVRAAGGVALLLPPGALDPAGEAASVLDGLHGLLIAGGADVDPQRYGQDRQEGTDTPRSDRDEWELALVAAARAQGLPLLGVCRGLQVLNVALGGTLFQHLPDVVGSTVHCRTIGQFSTHAVRIEAESRTGAAVGPRADVPTHHHQGVDRLASGLVATAWTDDGIVEAAETPGADWVVGVQWHPEVSGGQALFAAFVAAAAAYRDRVAAPLVVR